MVGRHRQIWSENESLNVYDADDFWWNSLFYLKVAYGDQNIITTLFHCNLTATIVAVSPLSSRKSAVRLLDVVLLKTLSITCTTN